MASFNGPKLTNPIRTDVPDTQEVLVVLAKQDPTPISDIPVGAKRLYEASSGKWQWQLYNGTSWAPVPFLQHNVDQLDGYHAAITPTANTVAVRNASGVLEDSITGNAATASSAATLSQTLPVNKGGTGATTSEAARANLGVPPTSHASTNTTHGVGNATQYGHLKLSDATNNLSGVSGGVAATPAAVKAAKDAADAAMTKASTLATASSAGIVKPGTGMTVDVAGALNVNASSSTTPGLVKSSVAALAGAVPVGGADGGLDLSWSLGKIWIGVPRYWRSTTLPTNHCWANGDFVEFADWPQLEQIFNAGGFAGMLMAWNANSGTRAANLGKWRPDAVKPTGLYTPNLTGQFLRCWADGGDENAGAWHRDEIRNITGIVYDHHFGTMPSSSGALIYAQAGLKGNSAAGSSEKYGQVSLDASQTVPTGVQNVPQHVWQPVIIYLGQPSA